MRSSRVVFLCIATFFIMHSIQSQIRGRVIEKESKEPLENVNVFNENTKLGTASDEMGFFSIKENVSKSDTLIFSYIGYQTEYVTLDQLKTANYNIELRKSTDELDSVDINTKKLQSKIEFEKLGDMPQALYGFSVNLVNNDLYIVAGSKISETNEFGELKEKYPNRGLDFLIELLAKNPNRDWIKYSSKIYKYDFTKKTWTSIQKSVIPRAYHNSAVIDNKIYIYGGKSLSVNRRYENLSNKIEIYNPVLDTLIIDETNPHLAVNFASFSKDSLLFIFGGSTKIHRVTNKKDFSNKVHVLNTKNGFWLELNSMPEPKETSGILVDDEFYFIGGNDGKDLGFIETYNIKNGKWQRIGKLFQSLQTPAIARKDDDIYILGKNRIFMLNTLTLNLKEYRIDLNVNQPKMVRHKNNLYIMGGYTETKIELKPSNGFYKVPLVNFEKTKIQRSKQLNDI